MSPICWKDQLGEIDQGRSEAEARLLRRHRHVLSRLLRHVGPEIAVGRPARAQGGEPRDRPARRSAKPRRSAPRKPNGNIVLQELRVRAADRARSVRSGAGQEAARRGRLSERVRRRRSARPCRPTSRTGEAIVGYLGAVGIRTRMRTMERAAFSAALPAKKLEGRVLVRDRDLRQRLDPHGGDRAERRHLCLWRLARYRRAVPAAADRDGSREARGDAAPDPEDSCTSGRGSRRSTTISGRAGSGRASRKRR